MTSRIHSVVSPLDGSIIADIEWADPAQVPALFHDAAMAQHDWAAEEPEHKRSVLLATARAIRERSTQIAELETLNTGKPVADTTREVERAARCFEYYAGWIDHVTGETLPMGPSSLVYTLREPVGVALGVIPWNMPFAFAAKKIAPALAFGNACVVKPAPETPLTAVILEEILQECGAPKGLVQIVVGGGELGAALTQHPGWGVIVFTGSVPTGKIVGATAATNLVPCVLELGGSSAQVVFADADLEEAADSVILGGFGSTGQMCVAGRRVLVHETIASEFAAMLRARVENLVAGDPRRPGIALGPQTTLAQRDLTDRAIQAAIEEGATLAAQGRIDPEASASGGFYVAPSLFTDLPDDSLLLNEEVFGPVVSLQTFRDDDDACKKVNASDFGLVAGMWTRDIVRAHRLAARIEAGTVWINTFRVLHDRVPFGGVKDSGYGRENGSSALETFTQVKSVWASLDVGNTHGYRLGSTP